MNQHITPIENLSRCSNNYACDLTIKATVLTKSIKHDNSNQMYFYFDLCDDSGKISGVAFDVACKKFFNVIEENNTYLITGFGLSTSDKHYTSIMHPKQLILRDESSISLCGTAPPIDWHISSLDCVVYGDEFDSKFFNVIGMCIGVSETDNTPDKLVRRVRLLGEDGKQATLAVWNSETFIFDELDLNQHPVFLVVDARVYNYGGKEILTTSRFLQLLDPEDPRARRVREVQARNAQTYWL